MTWIKTIGDCSIQVKSQCKLLNITLEGFFEGVAVPKVEKKKKK